MSMQTEYREQVDRMCGSAELPDGKELLEMAKIYAENGGTAVQPRRKIRIIRRSIMIAAACVTVAGMTAIGAGAAGYGPFSGLFREKYHDDTTADLVEQGYLYEINQSFTDGIYRADLIAVSGDRENPQLIIDLYIDNPAIAEINDTVRIGVYTLGVEQYEHELEQYGWCDGIAYRDAEIPNLYHASVRGAPAWMSYGEECVIDITAIDRNDLNGMPVIDRIHMETRLTIPQEAFQETISDYYSDEDQMILHFNDIDYQLIQANYSIYQTEFCMRVNSEEYRAAAVGNTRHSDDLDLDEALNQALILTVDGVEYSCNPDSCYIWHDPEDGFGSLAPIFPTVNFASAERVTLSAGDAVLLLKDPSIPRYTEEMYTEEPEDICISSEDYTDENQAILRFNDIDYHLNYAEYYETRTQFSFWFDAESNDDAALNDALTLTVDGVTYSCDPGCCYTWYDTEGEAGIVNRGYVHPTFPAIDYPAAKNIILSIGDASYIIKDEPAFAEIITEESAAPEEAPRLVKDYTDDDHAVLHFNDVDYHLNYVEFYDIRTKIELCFEAESYDDAALENTLVLVVDDKSYSCDPGSRNTWYDSEGEAGTVNRGYVYPTFPAFDYNEAVRIYLTLGMKTYRIK